MVQLVEKIMTTPKANKKEMAKSKTPSKSPEAVVMKAKDKNTPKQTPKIKKMVQKHLETPEPVETSVKTPKSNKKKNNNSMKIKEEIDSQLENLEVLPETPKSNKKKNNNSMKIKEEIDSQLENLEVLPETPKSNKKKNNSMKIKKEIDSQLENLEVLPETPKSNKKKSKKSKKLEEGIESQLGNLEVLPETPKINKKKGKKSKKMEEEIESQHVQNEEGSTGKDMKKKKNKSDFKNMKYQFSAYVSGLDFKIAEEEVHKHFSQYGTVNVYLPKNYKKNDDANNGYCFLYFKDKEDMLNAINGDNVLGGRKLSLRESVEKKEKRKREDDGNGAQANKKRAISSENGIYISGFTPTTLRSTVMKYFSKYGKVVHVKLRNKGDRRYGFVTFSNSCTLEKVMGENHKLDNTEISCQRRSVINAEFQVKVILDCSIKKNKIEKYFNDVGNVTSIAFPEVEGNSTKRNEGFVFITFNCEENMNEVLGKSHELMGFKLNMQPMQNDQESETRKREILVRNLPMTCTREELEKAFSKFGEIERVTLLLKNKKNPSEGCKNFCFIAFKTRESMEKAIAKSSMKVQKQTLEIINPNDSKTNKDTDDGKKDTDDGNDEEGESDEEGEVDEEGESDEEGEVDEEGESDED